MTLASISSRWATAARLVADTRDLLEGRPGGSGGEPPAALVSRGWTSFLLSLGDDELAAIETRGHDAVWPARTPTGLRALLEQARDVCALPAFPNSTGPSRPRRRGETPRKREQIDAFGAIVAPLATRATRVVDVGSGHGHLTREIAHQLALPVLGLERDATLARRARVLSSSASPRGHEPPREATFAITDVLRDGLVLGEGDCVIGLHACGELGDAMVTTVAQARGATLALVGCCLQKRRQESRRPLRVAPGFVDRLYLPRGLLGLSNLVAGDDGIEATRAENLAARERRLALHRLLSEGCGPMRLGAEIDGLNRRVAQRDLSLLVARAFTLRGRPVPSRAAVDDAASWARVEHARSRRLSVPRALLARVLEVYVLLDRAAYLVDHGFAVEIGALFPVPVSPRNLALVAARDASS